METQTIIRNSQERRLPAIVDLYNDVEIEITDKRNQLNVLLNQPPAESWLKEHPSIQGYKYIPINRIEYLLYRIFIKWRVEVKTVDLYANSMVVTVRLHYLDPVTGDWEWQDGVGASPLQTDKGAGAIDFMKMKNAAVMMAAPAAETYAIKDAAEKLGKLFGKDLNRKDQIGYDALLSTFEGHVELKNLKETMEKLLQHCPDSQLRDEVTNEVMDAIQAKVTTHDFYSRMIDKLSSNGTN